MRSILEELFYENICPSGGGTGSTVGAESERERELAGYIARHHGALMAELSDGQKEILEKFEDCQDELRDITERELFVSAFRLGARIAIEVLFPATREEALL